MWNPATCPIRFLPYLAWAFSVDRWDESWTESVNVEGVQRVELTSPLEDVVLDKTQAASCTEWSVTNGGTDE
ncbi:phage tail protein I [Salmonella enterica subsp. enterica]|nr:phage tail protein I [Salmonella enterica subsp. enterica]